MPDPVTRLVGCEASNTAPGQASDHASGTHAGDGPDNDIGWTPIGYVVKPHGVHGELRLQTHVAWDALHGAVTELRFTPKGGGASRVAQVQVRAVHRGVLVTLDGVDSPETAAKWRGAEVAVREQHIPPCEEGEFYLADLQDVQVLDAEGVCLGTMSRVLDNAGQPLGVIVTPAGDERLLPLVPQTIRTFEREPRRLHVRVPPGLWDA